ncbi:MAG: DEAD/DEAH box helicase family protein [Spirochaetaceae bacterium]|nr:DEAD/DEAH box helicase family protein [Spirochaetaceae bacterium]
MNLMKFQLNAMRELLIAMEEGGRDIILKSPTGSGKTIMLTHFMSEYIKGHARTVFIWLTPGKGNLEEQSKRKMDLYIHNSQTKLLSDVMTAGFCENDCCFINWEKLTKKGNNALKDSERTNFLEWIEKAHNAGLAFKVIIDESHQNFTEKSDAIVQLFKTDKIIRCSATPLADKSARLIEVKEADVIAEGLIKKLLVINENFPNVIEAENPTHYLLEQAFKKRNELVAGFSVCNADVNPLIVVQLPNNSDALLDSVIEWFEAQSISVENGTLAVWLSARHDNLEDIEKNDGRQTAVIIKQAVATGWDCPRAHILVKLREGLDETFEIQTIGRIRRMPEAHHYGNDLLDSCYLYTFDSKFTLGAQAALGKNALQAKTIFLKNEYKKFTLIKEQRTQVTDTQDDALALKAITDYLKSKYNLGKDSGENKTRLETAGFVFREKIERTTYSGSAMTIAEATPEYLNTVKFRETMNTHTHGREFHNRVGRIGLEIGLEYASTVTILGKLFANEGKFLYKEKLLELSIKDWYAFVINNFDELRHVFRFAMSAQQGNTLELETVSEKPFFIPQSELFTFDATRKVQSECKKNVYQGYLSSAEFRSAPEKLFEKFCETSDSVDWWYKNGDKGDEYFSIVYVDNSNRQKLFYPDYILSINGEPWIIETKGGFDRTGASEDIDIFSPKKCKVLQRYLKRHKLRGGFVRQDKASMELLICTGNYTDDVTSDAWQVLAEVW